VAAGEPGGDPQTDDAGAGSVTVGEVAAEWLAAAERGQVRTRSGTAYKPSALRSYERELRRRVYRSSAIFGWRV
jgi:hypothetical protein